MTYYDDLANDSKRVNYFRKVIQQKACGIAYDLGTGSGILAKFASSFAKKVYAIEQNPFIIKKARENLSKHGNVDVLQTDATNFKFPQKADVVICEMLDTALIDEEQVPVMNNALKYIKDTTCVIPTAVYTAMELVSTNINHITYYEDNLPVYKSLSEEIKYHYVSFLEHIDSDVNKEVSFVVKDKGIVTAIKLTTYTCLTDDVILEPTPMLNPPLFIPVEDIAVEIGDCIAVNIFYIMGRGLNTIKANIRKIS